MIIVRVSAPFQVCSTNTQCCVCEMRWRQRCRQELRVTQSLCLSGLKKDLWLHMSRGLRLSYVTVMSVNLSFLLFLRLLSSDDMDGPVEDIGSRSCVTRFVKTLLSIMEHGVKPHSKHLTEYFAFLYEFAKMGEEEVRFCTFNTSKMSKEEWLDMFIDSADSSLVSLILSFESFTHWKIWFSWSNTLLHTPDST